MQDRKHRIAERVAADLALTEDDRNWIAKTKKPGWRQLFLPDVDAQYGHGDLGRQPRTGIVQHGRHVDAAVPVAAARIGQRHEYGSFYICWALFATTGFWVGGWMIDRFGRRPGFAILLLEAAIFMTIWIFTANTLALWLLGMAWAWGLSACGVR